MIWSYSQKVSTLKQKKESTQQQIWFPFLAVFSPLIASFTRKKERGIESIMAPEASVSPLRRRPDNSDIMGKIIWSNIEIDVKINNHISFDMVSLLHKLYYNYFPMSETHYLFNWKLNNFQKI